MDFFSLHGASGPDPDDDDAIDVPPQPAWTGPPADTLGQVVAINAVVARTPHAVIAVPMITVHAAGILIDIRLAGRRGNWSRERWDDVVDNVFGGRRASRAHLSGRDFRVGVGLPDGRAAVAGGAPFPWDEQEPSAPSLVSVRGGSGSSGGRRLDSEYTYWLWPLADAAEFELVVAWPALEVPETRLPLSVDLSLGARAEPFWERQATSDS